MAYQALYRKYRSQDFDEMVGQKHVTKILKGQIESGNIAHAYLFCGTRGTGKTSTAKIFARGINCLSPRDGNPCNACEVCKGILDQSIMDVVEMDAASNNSVEDIRELREKVKYLPSKGKYKVYIIDEVHMLSKGAFNAFLKTLEEPPKHLIFILATTEPEKIPPTILSRCQRYDLKRLTNREIIEHMKHICEKEKVEIEEKALRLIAANADGAMRDALSILDQCIAYHEDGIPVTYEYIVNVLGIVQDEVLFGMAEAIADRNYQNLFAYIDDMVQNGKDVVQLLKDLVSHYRNLMLAKISNDLEYIIEGTEEYIEQIKNQSEVYTTEKIGAIIEKLSAIESQAKYSSQPRIVLEAALIGIMAPAESNETSKMEVLEKLFAEVKKGKTEKPAERPAPKETKPAEPGPEAVVSFEGQRQDVGLDEIKDQWSEILKTIRRDNVSLFAYLREGYPAKVEHSCIYIAFGEGFAFHRSAVEREKSKMYISNAINMQLKSNLMIKFVMEDEIVESKEETSESNDLLQAAKALFGEDIVKKMD